MPERAGPPLRVVADLLLRRPRGERRRLRRQAPAVPPADDPARGRAVLQAQVVRGHGAVGADALGPQRQVVDAEPVRLDDELQERLRAEERARGVARRELDARRDERGGVPATDCLLYTSPSPRD